ncbi:MAG: acyltransferase, partial [Chloroflexi bacterium]|nr:acyltransferase [Chloroflexota bacterium]
MPAPKAHVFDAKKDGSQSDIAVRPTAARPPQIPQLTGLRFIAAFFVVLYHYGQFTIQYPPWLNYAASVGNIGVSLFFVLSGFILTYNYLHQFENGPIGFTSFIKARFFRIYPMHFVMLAVFTVWYLARLGSTEYTNVVAFLLHLLAIQSLFPSNAVIHTLNDPSWSISAELVFYTTLPFFIRFVLRGKQTESSLMKLIASLYALELTLTIVHYALTHSVFAPGLADAGSPLTQGVGPNMAYFSPLIRIMEFFIGCGFAKLLLVQLDQRSDKQGGQFTAKKAPLMRIIPVAIAIIAMPGLLILFGRPVIT